MWPNYVDLDPARASVPIPPERPWKYTLLLLHVSFGSIALITACLQVWPWLRRRHPLVHRVSGNVYVVAGVLPSALSAVWLIAWIDGNEGAAWMSRVVLNVFWVGSTVLGLVMARRGRWAEHRWYMVVSFALTMDVFTARFVSFTLLGFTSAQITDDEFLDMINWGAWTVNLVLAFWWLERGRREAPATPERRGTRRLVGLLAVASALAAVVPFVPLDWLAIAVAHGGVPSPDPALLTWSGVFLAVALVTAVIQCWPSRRPRLLAARVHLLAGVLPAVLLGVLLVAGAGGGGWVGRFYVAALWLAVAVLTLRMARQGRWGEYRRYRVYGLALALDVVTMRLLAVVLPVVAPGLDVPSLMDVVGWCGWILNLVLAHAWLARTTRRDRPAAHRPVAAPRAPARDRTPAVSR
ncbi:DUF2306 domain-containing protein [Actinomycetospora sp. OC33-EN06]|uniref:DUF2306 domain-containing protein n=2 Tax=Actinomycetospora aeridis TaxID=3129231 RepID=A0ABU8N2Z1_9PSEU